MTDHVPDPPLFGGFPRNLVTRLLAGGDLRADAEQLASFRRFATAGDPLADALATEMRTLPAGEGRRLFEHALEHGIGAVPDPPPALAAFFDHVEAVPYWLDRAKLDRAAKAMTRTGVVGVYGALPDIALIGGYLAARPDKVLVRTGDLERKAPSRLAETANWWVEISTPGNLARDGAGFKAAVRVRLTHAHIRAAMQRRDDWDHDAWDAPVNQIHTAGTLMLFSLIFTVGLQALGFRFTRAEREAIFHLWRYVGRLMGVDPELLPVDEADAWRLAWLEAATEFVPDEDSRRLAQAMVAATGPTHGITGTSPPERLATWTLASLHSSFTRLALGDRNADHLGVPNRPPFHAAIVAFAAANFAVETVRKAVPGATRVSEIVGDRTRRAAMRRVTAATRADLSYTRGPDVRLRDAA